MIKLGGECNLKCKYCHSENHKYEFNPDIIDFVKQAGIRRVTFSGGEPLLYWGIIQNITKSLGTDFKYRMVSNLTLLTEDKVRFLNEYNFLLCGSYDGTEGLRDNERRPRWDLLSKINNHGFAVTVYQENLNLRKIQEELENLVCVNKLKNFYSYFPNFIHSTQNVESTTTLETAKEYLQQLTPMVETELISLLWDDSANPLRTRPMLAKSLLYWWTKKKYRGIRCVNEYNYSIALDGRFLACPYEHEFVGDIYTGLDLDKIDALTPQKCKLCPIFVVCKGACWTNQTNHECYIARKMNKWLNVVIEKWNAKEKVETALAAFKNYQTKENFS